MKLGPDIIVLLLLRSQVSQLDMVVKEHQSESEQKILQLESSLNKTQYELKQCSRQVGCNIWDLRHCMVRYQCVFGLR